jgi:hypothetical protein
MSFQVYIDTIKAKTGKTPADFKIFAEKQGLLKEGVKTGQIVSWLKEDFGLGHGHAMAIVLSLQSATQPRTSSEERIDQQFRGARSSWRQAFNSLINTLHGFGGDVSVSPTASYISILRGQKKFAVVAISAGRMDIGIKNQDLPSVGRLESSASWNAMVTHRVRIKKPDQIDQEVIAWLSQAYDRAH